MNQDNIKAVFVELDNCLFEKDEDHKNKTISDCMDHCLDKGIAVIYLTSRNVGELIALDELWFKKAYIIGMDNSFILDNDKNILLNNTIDPVIVDMLVSEYKNEPLEYVGGYMKYLTVDKDTYIDHCLKFFDADALSKEEKEAFINDFTYKTGFSIPKESFKEDGIYHISALLENDRLYKEIHKKISELTENPTSIMFDGVAMDISGYRISRLIAVNMMLDYLKLTKEEVLIIASDNENQELFENYPNTIAAANSSDVLKRSANEVLDDKDHAVAKKLESL